MWTSCRSAHDKELGKQLVGEWKIYRVGNLDVEKGPLKLSEENIPKSLSLAMINNRFSGYEFLKDGKCFNKYGYMIRKNHDRSWKSVCSYSIEEDSLIIRNPVDSSYEKSGVSFIGNDTLLLTFKGGNYQKYSRCKYSTHFSTTYDQIVFCRRGGWGNEPIYMTSIDKSGNVLCYGNNHEARKQLYSGSISRLKFDSLARAFQKVNIERLKNKYIIDCEDCSHNSVSFIKDHRIIKTIVDTDNESPVELIWAYLPLRFLYQHITLKQEPNSLSLLYGFVSLHHTICYLTDSESFFLQTELLGSKSVQHSIEKRYSMPCYLLGANNTAVYKLHTDGRYYQYQDNGKTVTLDLGYNFIERNKLEKRFVKSAE
jgi:hypothetical protein